MLADVAKSACGHHRGSASSGACARLNPAKKQRGGGRGKRRVEEAKEEEEEYDDDDEEGGLYLSSDTKTEK